MKFNSVADFNKNFPGKPKKKSKDRKKYKYEERIVVFLDILGFKEFIENTLVGNQIENVSRARKMFFNIRDNFDMDEKHWKVSKSLKTIQFSDSIIITFKVTEEDQVFYSLEDIQILLIELVKFGLLVRGAIVKGKVYHDERIVFGPGIVDAVMKEKAAKFPRVILDREIIQTAVKYKGKHQTFRSVIQSLSGIINKDEDGIYYIDYLEKVEDIFDEPYEDYYLYLSDLRKLIIKYLKSDDKSIRRKYEWVKIKFNFIIKKIKDKDYKTLYIKNKDIEK